MEQDTNSKSQRNTFSKLKIGAPASSVQTINREQIIAELGDAYDNLESALEKVNSDNPLVGDHGHWYW